MGKLSPEELETLAEKWLNGSITSEEQTLFDQWYEQDPAPLINIDSTADTAAAFKDRLLGRIKSTNGGKTIPARLVKMPLRRKAVRQWKIIAACFLLLVASGWLWNNRNSHDKTGSIQHLAPVLTSGTTIIPGHNGARLTLANGQKIGLDSTVKGRLATEGNSAVFNDGGQLSYEMTSGDSSSPAVSYNTLSAGKGNQYRLKLADGTQVWLNAASSITYPASFSSRERTVTLTGEAYFEVTHRKGQPFKVIITPPTGNVAASGNTTPSGNAAASGNTPPSGSRIVEVLGTCFNINAYEEEPTLKTTLLEGSVKMGQTILQPGEQASIGANGKIRVLKDAATDQAIAWKNGLFQFDHADLKSVMRQLSRWYGVDIRYEGVIPPRSFGGKISRYSEVSEVLKVLELSQVHFKIENKTIIVMP